jgi:hypothetical protein
MHIINNLKGISQNGMSKFVRNVGQHNPLPQGVNITLHTGQNVEEIGCGGAVSINNNLTGRAEENHKNRSIIASLGAKIRDRDVTDTYKCLAQVNIQPQNYGL